MGLFVTKISEIPKGEHWQIIRIHPHNSNVDTGYKVLEVFTCESDFLIKLRSMIDVENHKKGDLAINDVLEIMGIHVDRVYTPVFKIEQGPFDPPVTNHSLVCDVRIKGQGQKTCTCGLWKEQDAKQDNWPPFRHGM